MKKSSALDYLRNVNNNHCEDRTYRKHCSKCGECCSALLPLSKDDIAAVKKYLLTHDIKPEHSSSANTIDMTCPFLSKKKLCLIYEVRPLICRVFKCNKKVNAKAVKLLPAGALSLSNMWSVFFNDNRGDFLCSALTEKLQVLRR